MRDFVLLIRPKRSLLRAGILTAVVLTTPLFAVLYWYTSAHGTWHWVLAAHLFVALLCALAVLRQTKIFAGVTAERLVGNGIFSRTVSVPIAGIQGVVFAKVYPRDSPETATQFVALDPTGRCRFRMRGQYWHLADLEAIAAALGVEVTQDPQPLNQHEFFEKYPGSKYWFERGS
jgi:hypothetical protein